MPAVIDVNSVCYAMIEHMKEGVVFRNTSGKILYCNQVAEKIFGILNGKNQTVRFEDFPLVDREGNALSNETSPFHVDPKEESSTAVIGLLQPDKGTCWLDVTTQNFIDEASGARLLLSTFTDVTDEFQIKAISKKQEEYVSLIDENIITSSTDTRGIITYASQAFCDISGYTKEELLGSRHNIVRHPDMPATAFREMWRTIRSGKTWRGEIKNLRKDGSDYWVYATIYPIYEEKSRKRDIIGYTAIRLDISDKKRVEALSITDDLTGLYNRRHFNNTLPLEIQRARRDKKHFTFALVDVDHFKLYNDTYGHPAGDAVLKDVATTLGNAFNRAGDYVFRLGGEEFCLMFSGSTPENSLAFLQRIKDEIENLKIENKNSTAGPHLTVSIGMVCALGTEIPDEDTIYQLADEALYQAKETGRNRIVARKLCEEQ